jgi:hypothetical protein
MPEAFWFRSADKLIEAIQLLRPHRRTSEKAGHSSCRLFGSSSHSGCGTCWRTDRWSIIASAHARFRASAFSTPTPAVGMTLPARRRHTLPRAVDICFTHERLYATVHSFQRSPRDNEPRLLAKAERPSCRRLNEGTNSLAWLRSQRPLIARSTKCCSGCKIKDNWCHDMQGAFGSNDSGACQKTPRFRRAHESPGPYSGAFVFELSLG